MPIYAYRCAACGHTKDVLQKLSDPILTVCPACGAQTFSKQLTAAGFQLKGSGWYATDFKDKAAAKPATNGDAAVEGKPAAPTDAPASPSAAPATVAPAAAPAAAKPATDASGGARSA